MSAAVSAVQAGVAQMQAAMASAQLSAPTISGGGGGVAVPGFAVGGIFDAGPRIIGVGEDGPEAVLPIAKIVPLFRAAFNEVGFQQEQKKGGGSTGVDGAVFNLVVDGVMLESVLKPRIHESNDLDFRMAGR